MEPTSNNPTLTILSQACSTKNIRTAHAGVPAMSTHHPGLQP
jgi:hypothetical protein